MGERYIASVDLGTSKIALAVAKVDENDVQVVYYGETPSDGIRYSYVFNQRRAGLALKTAIDKAEKDLDIKITQAVVGFPRFRVIQQSATAKLVRTDPDSSITEEEVDSLKSTALDSYPIPDVNKFQIYGAVAQSFSTDDTMNQVEEDVVGMPSENLEGNFNVFLGSRNHVNTIDSAFNLCGVAVAGRYFTPSVVARAVLTEEEKENGVALIDFGAGAVSVAIFKNRVLRYYASIPFGGNTITSDIKSECNITFRLAENIKLAYGICRPDKLQNMSEKIIQINNLDSGTSQQLPVKYLSEIITARTEEIFDAILYSIQESGLSAQLRSGVVLTGGCANMGGCALLLKDMSGYNVRIGYPRPLFSAQGCTGTMETGATTAIGMLLSAKDDGIGSCADDNPKIDAAAEWFNAGTSDEQKVKEHENAAEKITGEEPAPATEEIPLTGEAGREEPETEENEPIESDRERRRREREEEEQQEEEERRRKQLEEEERKRNKKPEKKKFPFIWTIIKDTLNQIKNEDI